MTTLIPDNQNETLEKLKFWNFLAYIQKYVIEVKGRTLPDDDPGRISLLSKLTENMRPVLQADISCVGYRSLDNGLQVVEATIKPEGEVFRQSPLILGMKELDWHFPIEEFSIICSDNPIALFDQGLQKLPCVFQGKVTAFAASRVTFIGREYFLFFFDLAKKVMNSPRYTDFDKTMLKVATGLLEIGFQSGVRTGRKESLRNQVFISYSHKDLVWLERLQIHLKPLGSKRKIIVWDDTKIKPGTKWREEIQRELSLAKVAVMLVSPNFLASDFIAKYEFPKILRAAKEDGLIILWIAISASNYKDTAIEQYQAANDPNKTLDKMKEADRNIEFVKICTKIKEAIHRPPRS